MASDMRALPRHIGESVAQHTPCNIGPELFAAHGPSSFPLDFGAALSRHTTLTTFPLAYGCGRNPQTKRKSSGRPDNRDSALNRRERGGSFHSCRS